MRIGHRSPWPLHRYHHSRWQKPSVSLLPTIPVLQGIDVDFFTGVRKHQELLTVLCLLYHILMVFVFNEFECFCKIMIKYITKISMIVHQSKGAFSGFPVSSRFRSRIQSYGSILGVRIAVKPFFEKPTFSPHIHAKFSTSFGKVSISDFWIAMNPCQDSFARHF